MTATCDVAIVGGGIVGAACADSCSAAGMRVTVVEAGPLGGGATAAGMGHIVVMDDSPAQIALTQRSRSLWMALAGQLPADAEYLAAGTIWVAADAEEMAEVKRKRALYAAIGVRAEVLGPRELSAAEPNLRPGLEGGLLVPDDAVTYPPCAARFLLERAQARGAVLLRAKAVELTETGVRLAGGETVSAGTVVNAAGAWAPELTPGIAVRGRKGHLAITDRYPGFLRHQLVELGYLKSAHSNTADSVAFNAQPRPTGQVLIGSSRQFGAGHSAVDPPILTRMLERARAYMPPLADLAVIRCWTGFRAATPDKLPLIGPCPGRPRLLLATGHEGLGITTSLATGELVAAHLLARSFAIPPEPYLPSRELGPEGGSPHE